MRIPGPPAPGIPAGQVIVVPLQPVKPRRGMSETVTRHQFFDWHRRAAGPAGGLREGAA
ncbi:hypothetical protein NtRootA4_41310 (plasmid) [Arthrobacter sp. NtRootA4]|nr:hypothetical protein NtRootA4_41310 [Arthrobacter sp. NtRootA4]BCW25260.1 hypothetical protein NtRootC7_41270 [Arthrobacter sp. NtRootC7]BCW29621.1 hypothetical protein NtRootC45_42210 [Arthrobacter sp. NtRootC45]BCW33842.1 hypothetical protein NtRootD5_41730 [Arthrobacter sp. NtRootD5]